MWGAAVEVRNTRPVGGGGESRLSQTNSRLNHQKVRTARWARRPGRGIKGRGGKNEKEGVPDMRYGPLGGKGVGRHALCGTFVVPLYF